MTTTPAPGALRLAVGYTAVAAALPYLTLKIAWVTGHPIGFTDPTLVHDPTMLALNTFTFGMDAVAVLVALTFTHRWGMRAPAWLVAFPMWVGTGFLAPIAVAAPIGVLLVVLSGGDPLPATGTAIVAPWVYGVVYTGFVTQGIALMTAFVLYARARWNTLLNSPLGAIPRGPSQPLQSVFAVGLAALAATVGGLHLHWALGGTLGLTATMLNQRDIADYVVESVFAILAVAGCLGILIMARRLRPATRFWVPLVMAWVGAAAMFSWGLWQVLLALSASSVRVGGEASPLLNLTSLGQLLCGLLIGTVGAFVLAERATIAP